MSPLGRNRAIFAPHRAWRWLVRSFGFDARPDFETVLREAMDAAARVTLSASAWERSYQVQQSRALLRRLCLSRSSNRSLQTDHE